MSPMVATIPTRPEHQQIASMRGKAKASLPLFGVQPGQFVGEFLLAVLQVGDFLADLTGPERSVKRGSGVKGVDTVIFAVLTSTRVVSRVRPRSVNAASAPIYERLA
jgi:hypothetical protein